MWKESVEQPEKFFGNVSFSLFICLFIPLPVPVRTLTFLLSVQLANELLTWSKPFETVRHGSFESGDVAWFLEGELNACYNCVDRHALKNPDKVSFLFFYHISVTWMALEFSLGGASVPPRYRSFQIDTSCLLGRHYPRRR
jgi:Acetyl-coenzyme A synthetase N-terminus